jgi:hypothetical protein
VVKNGSNTFETLTAGIPGPSSAMLIRVDPLVSQTDIEM